MQVLELIKNKITWIVFATVIFYIIFILISDVEKISQYFLQIKLEFLVLIVSLVFLSHVVKSFRQKELLKEFREIEQQQAKDEDEGFFKKFFKNAS